MEPAECRRCRLGTQSNSVHRQWLWLWGNTLVSQKSVIRPVLVARNQVETVVARGSCLAIRPIKRKFALVRIKLTAGEIEHLNDLVGRSAGSGGFQNLLLYVWYRLDQETGELDLPGLLLERIHRYAFAYKSIYWRKTLRKIFRRTLGANLDRSLVLR